MNKEMIVTSNGHQTMVAILEDDQVVEVSVERERQRGRLATSTRAGSRRCCPACSRPSSTSGSERDGFLYVSDVVDTMDTFERMEGGRRRGRRGRGAGARRRAGQGRRAKDRDAAQAGQEILVQVVKEPLGTKARGSRRT